jgi:hypothetical protein
METDFEDFDFGTISSVDSLECFKQYQYTFEMHYGQHKCDTRGCPYITVWDGHVKVRRYVCWNRSLASSFVPMRGWPKQAGQTMGGFHTGCPNEPRWQVGRGDPKAKFCKSCDGKDESSSAAQNKPEYITPGQLHLSCDTDKGERAKSVPKPGEERTAGTLAGINPCGLIISVREMQRHER